MADGYDVPGNMFGPVPEPFYGAIGRVVMVASMLDMRLLELLWALDEDPQDVHAGRATADIMKRTRVLLAESDDDVRSAGLALLDQVRTLLDERNALVHSIWPTPTLDDARGWRHVHPKRRVADQADTSGSAVAWTEVTADSLSDLIRSMVDAFGRLGRLAQDVHVLRGRRIVSGN